MGRGLLLVIVFAIALWAALPTAAGQAPPGRRPRPTIPVMTLVPPPICPDRCPPPD